jgi:3-oxoacyl-[acyl-carrier-protein] synthase-3
MDKSVRTLFGDAGSATLITAVERDAPTLGPFVLGTDGSGAQNLIVPRGGMRKPATGERLAETTDDSGNVRTEANLFMNGPAIFEFTIRRIPAFVKDLLAKAGLTMDDIQHVVLHQANEYMLRYLQKKLNVPDEKFAVDFAQCGNTVSSTIPIVLQHLAESGRLKTGDRIMTVGFGVGYSWGANLIVWSPGA